MSELSRVMIHKTSARVLSAACWSCGKSDTYCDGLWSEQAFKCCVPCRNAEHNAHTGLPYDEDD